MQQFNVQGMTCGHCVRAITQAILRSDPAADVKIDLAAAEVKIDSSLTSEVISRLIADEGYLVKA